MPPIPSSASTAKVWLSKPETWPVLAVIAGGLTFTAWFSFRTASTHNDVVINKTKPYQYRVEGDEPKLVRSLSHKRRELRYNEKTMRWE